MNQRYKKFLSLVLAFLMVVSSFGISYAQTTDYQNHWAAEKISEWIEKVILTVQAGWMLLRRQAFQVDWNVETF